jgi:hypothetical protein
MWARFAILALLAAPPANGNPPSTRHAVDLPEIAARHLQEAAGRARLARLESRAARLERRVRHLLKTMNEPMDPDVEQVMEELGDRHDEARDAYEALVAAPVAQWRRRSADLDAALEALEEAYDEAAPYEPRLNPPPVVPATPSTPAPPEPPGSHL